VGEKLEKGAAVVLSGGVVAKVLKDFGHTVRVLAVGASVPLVVKKGEVSLA
jgi:preprotein translocase subunit YajC